MFSQNTVGVKSQGGKKTVFSHTPLESNHKEVSKHCCLRTQLESNHRRTDNGVLSEHHGVKSQVGLRMVFSQDTTAVKSQGDCERCSLRTPLESSHNGV